MIRRVPMRALLTAALVMTACGDAGSQAAGDPGSGERARLTVFVAASLAEAFDELAATFVADHPNVEVEINAAGSHTLAHQINQGAPADVFASSAPGPMAVVDEAGNLAGPSRVFASNHLAIAVEVGNPHGVRGLADLADPDLVVALPGEQVPAGAYARRALDAAGLTVTPASLEPDVRAALGRVALGEADASVVYASDVLAAGERVEGVAIPPEANVTAAYPIAALAGASAPSVARDFVRFVLDEAGQSILARHGLGSP